MLTKEIYYLATPYSHQKRLIREERFDQICLVGRILIAGGLRIYSPITHSHPMCDHETGNHLMEHEGWLKFEEPFMDLCTHLIIVYLDGWKESTGVEQEFTRMHIDHKKPVIYIHPYSLQGWPDSSPIFYVTIPSYQNAATKLNINDALVNGLRAKPVYPFGPNEDVTFTRGWNRVFSRTKS